MLKVNLEAHGFAELHKSLKDLEPHLQKRVLAAALGKAAKPILAHAQANVAVDEGKLRDGLKIKKTGPTRKRPHRQSARVTTPTRKQLEIPAEATGYYPAVIEYGSETRQLAPRPFLRPALAANQEQAISTLREETAKGIKSKFRRRFRAKNGLSFAKLTRELT